MHRVAARLTLLGFVLAGGVVATYFLLAIDRQDRERASAQQDAASRLDRVSDAVIGISAAQRAFVTPGNLDERSLERVTALVTQINDETTYLKARLRSADATKALQSLNTATTDLITVNTRARDNLRLGQDATASDIMAGGRSTLDVIRTRIGELRAAERALSQAESTRLARQRWMVLGAAALLWTAGLLVLTPTRSSSTTLPIAPPVADVRQDDPKVGTDLTAAAALCTSLSRITTTAALPPLLAQAADLLDAAGIILWMGAGDQLFAVTAHGYRPDTLGRLGPISRGADNATASAWRTGQSTTVAGHATLNGAIVTPMFGPDTCIGALAIELRRGREHDRATHAVASMIAAQLAAVVSAWPAGSTSGEIRSASA